eukprot:CAMPEP_0116844882 /NCGR_PEP_ID=MMETSP0418-20121206/12948_1 /TAXON_ID=1158023 /ORGANISM="Astrosyne radiata, Strain 13vi08-1A" /LENGTH=213 /DNA_ID=CAMNT_0004475911 /DNA_START=123 /DNA_END=764 /DNA_ORIENTATION=+
MRRRPRVSFEKVEVVGCVPPSSTMSQERRNELWYPQADLAQFKNDARDLCRRIRHSNAEQQPLLDVPHMDCTKADCTRGLEHRASVERQRNKFLAMRAILKAQSRCSQPEQLAVVASKCTAWAKEIALCTGYQDFYFAYNPALLHLVPQTPTAKFPLVSRKRSSSSSSSSSIGSDDDSLSSGSVEAPSSKRQRTTSPVPAARQTTTPQMIFLQ